MTYSFIISHKRLVKLAVDSIVHKDCYS